MIDEPDFLRELGVSALGSRIRRLFETINGPVAELYRDRLCFEQRWFALTLLLEREKALSIQVAADRLGSSHVSVLQIVKSMEAAGLVERSKDPDDRRVTRLSLTQAGERMARDVRRISAQVDTVASDLLSSCAPNLLRELTALEEELRESGFGPRLANLDIASPESEAL